MKRVDEYWTNKAEKAVATAKAFGFPSMNLKFFKHNPAIVISLVNTMQELIYDLQKDKERLFSENMRLKEEI